MSVNTTGTCSVTPGSAVVSMSNANYNLMVAGDLFRLAIDKAFYTVASVNASAEQIVLTSRYSNLEYETTVTSETVDTGDDTSSYSFTLANTPVIIGTAEFSDEDDIETFTDNLDGTLTGDAGGTGTISYDDGSVSLEFDAPIASGKIIYADTYDYGSTINSVSFVIVRDFTDRFKFPEPDKNENAPELTIRRAIRMIDYELYKSSTTEVKFVLFDSDVSVSVADGKAAFTIPYIINSYVLTDVIASVHTKGITATTDLQIRRRRVGVDVDMLTTPITIGDEYYARDGVIDATYDDVATGDQIYIDVDAIHSGTAPLGLSVTLTFNKAT